MGGRATMTAVAPTLSACRARSTATFVLSAPTETMTGPCGSPRSQDSSARCRRSSVLSRNTSDTIASTIPSTSQA